MSAFTVADHLLISRPCKGRIGTRLMAISFLVAARIQLTQNHKSHHIYALHRIDITTIILFTISTMTDSKLFQPINIGDLTLNHRIVLAPLTRMKSTEKGHLPYTSVMKEYYSQRASDPGTLLITEATLIAQKAGVFKNIPGMWSQEQIDAWKEVCTGTYLKSSSHSQPDNGRRPCQRLLHLRPTMGPGTCRQHF